MLKALLAFISLFIMSCGDMDVIQATRIVNIKAITDIVYREKESAYFEGQYDAMHGDVRIRQVDSLWVWTKSPWCSGQQPVWNPGIWKKSSCDTVNVSSEKNPTRTNRWW